MAKRRTRMFRLGVALAAASVLALGIAAAASAADTLYWINHDGGGSISLANLDGSGGGPLSTAGGLIEDPEGMTIDSATGRLYWSSSKTAGGGAIYSAGLDGSGGAERLSPGAAPVDRPWGIAIDPTTNTIYWANRGDPLAGGGSISYLHLDGSGGGRLNTTEAIVDEPEPVAIDLAGGRIYWGNHGSETINYANLDNSGDGGQLGTAGATAPKEPTGLAIDPVSSRIYWLGESTVSYAKLAGGGGRDLNLGAATYDEPSGAAIDPAAGRIYWGNFGREKEREGAIAYANLSGGGGGDLNIATAPVDSAQDPVILRTPSAVAMPRVSGAHTAGSVLTCSPGAWAADLAGSYLYQAPHTYSYQWTLNGAPIAGSSAGTHTATDPGSYACAVTASNQAGSATQASLAFAVTPPPATIPMGPTTLKLTKVKLNKKQGTATVLAQVSGPGKLRLTGTSVVKATRGSRGAGVVVKLIVRAKGKAKKLLVRKGKAKVRAKVTFAPGSGGAAVSKTKSIVLKKKARKSH